MQLLLKSVLFTIYLSLDLAFGAALTSDIVLWKPWGQLSSDLGRVPLSYSFSVQPGEFSANSWNFNIPSVSAQAGSNRVNYNIDNVGIHMKLDSLHFQMQIPKISLSQTVEQVVNGSVIRVKVFTECAPISLSNQGIQVQSRLRWVWLDGFPSPQLQDLNLVWTDGSWQISSISCSGPLGINELFLNQLKTFLNDKMFIKSLIYSKIAEEIQKHWQSFHSNLISGQNQVFPTQDENSQITLERIAVWNQQGFAVRGKVRTSYPSVTDVHFQIDPQSLAETNFELQKVLIPKKLIEFLALQQVAGYTIEKMDLRGNSDFMNLLKSRFFQFFLWPDLLAFKKSARFEVQFSKFKDLKLDWHSKATAHVTGQLPAALWGERDSFAPYLDVGMSFSIPASISLQNNIVNIQAEKPQIDLMWKFNSDYASRHSPSEYISSKIFKAAKTAIGNTVKINTSMSLKSIVGDNYRILDYQLRGENVVLDFN